ncbi:lycopene cyclase domain-containing protein [Candidatus Marsarchaeota archaeon]|jgi:lycopene cyclase domain-containing protein|nr:lycopene cyclase domain-containing protein [Candidatus Marsarchaeota archaeon]MCL5099504.1 lycopene cyclase domain-containing protein [Candidatus Marsarchaeota archaeon]
MLNYIYWLAVFTWAPLVALWASHRKLVVRYKKTLALCTVSALAFSVPWDMVAIRSGMWYFPRHNILGFYLLGVPLEEYLFMISVTLLVSTLILILKQHRFFRKA